MSGGTVDSSAASGTTAATGASATMSARSVLPGQARRPARATRAGPERGQVTFVGVGLAIGLLMIGGLSIDLWRVLTARRALAETADAAAAAGANAIDLGHYRRTGELRLDDGLAVAVAADNLRQQQPPGRPPVITQLDAGGGRVLVGLETTVDLTLLRLFTLDEPITVSATAEAVPVRGP